jgi:hypothetical protein
MNILICLKDGSEHYLKDVTFAGAESMFIVQEGVDGKVLRFAGDEMDTIYFTTLQPEDLEDILEP